MDLGGHNHSVTRGSLASHFPILSPINFGFLHVRRTLLFQSGCLVISRALRTFLSTVATATLEDTTTLIREFLKYPKPSKGHLETCSPKAALNQGPQAIVLEDRKKYLFSQFLLHFVICLWESNIKYFSLVFPFPKFPAHEPCQLLREADTKELGARTPLVSRSILMWI